MKVALVTPFIGHLPLHPSSYLGYGTAILKKRFEVDVIDFNAEICLKNNDRLKNILLHMENSEIVLDSMCFHLFYEKASHRVQEVYNSVCWQNYQLVFITTPSWFVTVPTKNVLKLSSLIKKNSPQSKVVFFGNSLGTWTSEADLRNNNVHVSNLNNLYNLSPTNDSINYDALPTPVYKNRKKYIFNILPFRLKHGCIWGKCKFCSLSKGWNSGYLERASQRVTVEIEEIIEKYDPKMLACRDNSINGNNLLEFCTFFKNMNKPWGGMARADLSEKEINALEKAGCKIIYFGLESGSDRILSEINKGIDSKQMSRFIRKLYDHNIIPVPSLFVGAPSETEKDFQKSIQFISDHKYYLNIINLYSFRLTPASDYSLSNKESNRNTTIRLNQIISLCRDIGIKICVGEQCAEYVLFKSVYPSTDNKIISNG